jgi:TRAP-type uncharacterized transport system substrate-binding protein
MLKKISIMALSVFSAFALSFSSAGKQDKNKYINIDGQNFQYVIGTASKTGSYYAAGYKLTKQLPEAIAAETDGSMQNMDLLSQGVLNVAFVQGDAYNLWCNSHKAQCENDFAVVDTGHSEVIQIMCKKGNGIKDDGDLQTDGVTVDVGPLNSGGSASWDNMSLLEPNFKKAKKITEDTLDETSIFKIKQGKYNCLMRTATWDTSNSFVQKAIQNGLVFINVTDWDLDDKIKINGKEKPIYSYVKTHVKYPGDWISTLVKTIKTNTYIVVNKNKLSRKQLNRLLDVVTRLGNGIWQ